jgi:hypothetical protein
MCSPSASASFRRSLRACLRGSVSRWRPWWRNCSLSSRSTGRQRCTSAVFATFQGARIVPTAPPRLAQRTTNMLRRHAYRTGLRQSGRPRYLRPPVANGEHARICDGVGARASLTDRFVNRRRRRRSLRRAMVLLGELRDRVRSLVDHPETRSVGDDVARLGSDTDAPCDASGARVDA